MYISELLRTNENFIIENYENTYLFWEENLKKLLNFLNNKN